MWKFIALGSTTLLMITLSTIGYFLIKGTTQSAEDGRLSIALRKEERNLVLTEMRMLLEGVQTILQALTENQLKVVEHTASSMGMRSAADVNPSLMSKLPMDFKAVGMEVHRRFDELALKVHSGAGKDEILKEVSDIMLSCVGCHQAYRLDEVRE